MSKRGIGKADTILDEARERVRAAQGDVREARTFLQVAEAALNAHQDAYAALERVLAGEPRKPAPKSTPAPAAAKKSKDKKAGTGTEKETVSSTDVCADCENGRDYFIHSPDNPKGHEFKAAKAKGASANVS